MQPVIASGNVRFAAVGDALGPFAASDGRTINVTSLRQPPDAAYVARLA